MKVRSARAIAPALALATAFLVVAYLAHIVVGSVRIPLGQALGALVGSDAVESGFRRIILDFRLPRATTAALAGAGLAIGGLFMQTLFRNPLAGPFVLGINAGASLGVALVVMTSSLVSIRMVTGSGLLTGTSLSGDAVVAAASVLGSASVLFIVLAVSHRVANAMTLLVLGVLFSYAVGSVVSVLMHFSIPQEIQTYINWTFGSFAGVSWREVPILATCVGGGIAMSFFLVKPLNAMLLGDDYAASMGVHVRLVRYAVIVATALLAGAVTAFCGPIAFLGVAIPHLARGMVREADHRKLLPLVIVLGAAVAVIADLVAALPGLRITLPLNAVMALVGAPVVISIILRRGDLRGGFE